MAIPLSDIRWEREENGESKSLSKKTGGEKRSSKPKSKPEPSMNYRSLTPEQSGLRRTALLTIIGLIESLEPFLLQESGKTQDEWDRWWAGLNQDLLEKDGLFNGECLEVGAWWAQKK